MARNHRLTPQATRPGTAPVSVVRPDPQAWSAALALAGGEPHRIEVVAPDCLLVHNRCHRQHCHTHTDRSTR